jgi:hypothetical protein
MYIAWCILQVQKPFWAATINKNWNGPDTSPNDFGIYNYNASAVVARVARCHVF